MTVHLERFPIADLLDSQICKKKKEDDTLEGQQYFTTHPLKKMEMLGTPIWSDTRVLEVKLTNFDSISDFQ